MPLFSERHGLTSPRTALQIDSIDDGLRNCLWSALSRHYFIEYERRLDGLPSLNRLLTRLWLRFYKLPIDTLDHWWPSTRKALREDFFKMPWYGVYDLLEFVVGNVEADARRGVFVSEVNRFLEQEKAGFRFVGTTIARLVDPVETEAIAQALVLTAPFGSSAVHLAEALSKLSDRQAPDYRNSIKESISAVEAACRVVAGDDRATLSQALTAIAPEGHVHPALRQAFEKLYGYTSDAEGIRHALLEESQLDFDDAKFMLVAASAFVNYLTGKYSKVTRV